MTATPASQRRVNSLFDDASRWPKRPRCEKLWRRLFLRPSETYSKRLGYAGCSACSSESSHSSCTKVSSPFTFSFLTSKLIHIGSWFTSRACSWVWRHSRRVCCVSQWSSRGDGWVFRLWGFQGHTWPYQFSTSDWQSCLRRYSYLGWLRCGIFFFYWHSTDD